MLNCEPSLDPGMGALPHAQGTVFRVWAPHADRVFVTGSFNNWSQMHDPLCSKGNGYWSANIPGAKPGDEYNYVIVNGANELLRIDPYAKDVTSSVGNSIICEDKFDWEDSTFQMPPLNEMIVYELHIGTFNDRPGGPPGTLEGAIEKIPYLKDLGINAMEVMPVMEFAGGFSWGYNPAHIFAVESDYGGPRAFKEFVKQAHAHDIAVIFDVVYNHFGPGDLSLWQFDGWCENNLGGIYFYNDGRSKTPWGDTRPDYGKEDVRRYIRDNALMWLEEYRVDGLRWDMTAYIRNASGSDNDPEGNIPEGWTLMQWINDEMRARHPRKIAIAEDMQGNARVTGATTEGGAGFHAQWDPNFVHPVRHTITVKEDASRDPEAVRAAIEYRYDEDAFSRVIYTESHDEVANGKARVPEEISPGNAGSYMAKKLSTVGAVLTFTSPGIPMIFQGQEFLEDEWFHDEDPIDWSRKETFGGILRMYQDLIRLRRNLHRNTGGLCGQHVHVHHVSIENNLIAYHRWSTGGAGDDVIVALNLSNRAFSSYRLGFPHAGSWVTRFNSDWEGYDPSFSNQARATVIAEQGEKDGMPCKGDVVIGPYSAIILSQDP